MTKVVHKGSLLFAAGLMLASGSAFADWQGQISQSDLQRLAAMPAARTRALEEASHGAGQGDLRALQAVVGAPARGVPEAALYGTWRCRQMKLGGMADYMVYSWFTCRISRVNGGLWFQKEGTQRMAGYLYPQDGMWVYLGAQSAKGEPLHRYSGNAGSLGASVNPDDQVGALVGIGRNRLRLDLPSPAIESDFDTIELVR